MKSNFVVFYSPGEKFDEEFTFPIDEWNYEKAVHMAYGIINEGICIPYAFNFETRTFDDFGDYDQDDNDICCTYFLGGEIFNRFEMFDKYIFIYKKMKMNDFDRVIFNKNSSIVVKPFRDEDIILDFHV